MRFLSGMCCLLMLGAIACSSDDESRSGSPSQPQPNRTWFFSSDAIGSGSTVSLRQAEISETTLVVELVGNGVTDGYGIAFRLQYDPAVFGFSKMTPSSAWSTGTIQIAREA